VVEVSVGVGIGLVFLAREGLSFAMLKTMPGADEVEDEMEAERKQVEEPARARAGLSG